MLTKMKKKRNTTTDERAAPGAARHPVLFVRFGVFLCAGKSHVVRGVRGTTEAYTQVNSLVTLFFDFLFLFLFLLLHSDTHGVSSSSIRTIGRIKLLRCAVASLSQRSISRRHFRARTTSAPHAVERKKNRFAITFLHWGARARPRGP